MHQEHAPFPWLTALGKELRFQWSLCYGFAAGPGGTEFADAAAMMARHPQLAKTLITHRFSLEDAAEAFRVAGDKSSGAIKVVVHP